MNRTIRISDIESRQELPDDVIYYNIFIPNDAVDLAPANYNQILQVPIINKADEYFLAIVRFSIPGAGIPIFTMYVDPITGYSNFWVTLVYNGNAYPVNLVYSPNIDPLVNLHRVYSYNDMISMINTGLSTAFTNLKTSNPGAPPTEAPFMNYNTQGNICSLYCQTSYDPVVAGSPTIEIYFNNMLYYLFDNFFIIRTGNQNVNYQDYKFVITNLHNNYITSDVNNSGISIGNPYYKFQQEYASTYNFTDTQGIYFTSCLFPTAPEFTQTTANQVTAGEKILADFEPLQSLSDPSGFRGYIQYYAQGVYRLINLTTNSSLRQIDLQIFYKDTLGNSFPLLIPRNQSVSVKLAFIKKSLYKSTYAH